MPDNRDGWVYRMFDALSLSGAISLMLFALTLYGIFQQNEKVWMTFGSSFTTFVTGKSLGKKEGKE